MNAGDGSTKEKFYNNQQSNTLMEITTVRQRNSKMSRVKHLCSTLVKITMTCDYTATYLGQLPFVCFQIAITMPILPRQRHHKLLHFYRHLPVLATILLMDSIPILGSENDARHPYCWFQYVDVEKTTRNHEYHHELMCEFDER